MSKRPFKSQASSSRAAGAGGFGGFSGFGSTSAKSTLSYLSEPPNFSSISDPNVIVSFKNLSKKDRSTKARGLEDLRSYVQAHPFEKEGGVEEAVLEVWVQLYPRTAIDNDRYVRELSHEVQFKLAKSVRKRIEKYIPKVVGTWLAGTSDRDRGVAKMAQNGIKSLFDSEDKYKAFLKRCQGPILDYALEAIKETPETLSDERNTSADDMEAKYFRVLFSANWQILNLLSNLTQEDVAKCQDKYEEFLSSNSDVWSLVASKDAPVRKSTCELLSLCLDRQHKIIERDLPSIVQAFIGKGLQAGQSITAKVLLDTIGLLQKAFPQTWTRKSLANLRKFIAKGSQGGGIEYWSSLQTLIELIPPSVLPSDFATSVDFLNSFRRGISSREEAKTNSTAAWSSYLRVARILGEIQQSSILQAKFYQETVFPVFDQYLHPVMDNSQWSISDPSIVAEAYNLCSLGGETDTTTDAEHSFGRKWQEVVANILERLRTSLPEQSKDYHKSQESVAAESHRWFVLLERVLSNSPTSSNGHALSNIDPLVQTSTQLLNCAIGVLVSREGKPYSAAETLFESIKWPLTHDIQATYGPLAEWFREAMKLVRLFLEKYLPKLILSPSGPALTSSLRTLPVLPEHEEACKELWKSTIQSVLATSEDNQLEVVTNLIYNDVDPELSDTRTLTSHLNDLVRAEPALQTYLLNTAVKAVEGEAPWGVLESMVSYDSLTGSTTTTLLERMAKYLKGSGGIRNSRHISHIENTLKALDLIFKTKPDLLTVVNDISSDLATRLMRVTDIHPDLLTPSYAVYAEQLVVKMIEFSSAATNGERLEESLISKVIRENLRKYDRDSFSPLTLSRYAGVIIRNSPTASKDSVIRSLLPVAEDWHLCLGPLLYYAPQDCLSMTNTLKGAVSLVNIDGSIAASAPFYPAAHFPDDALNSSFRFAMYTINLLAKDELTNQVPRTLHQELLYHLLLFVELAKDFLGVPAKCGLYMHGSPGNEETVQELMVPIEKHLDAIVDNASSWRNGTDERTSRLVYDLIHECIEPKGFTARAFYAARILCRLLSAVSERHGWQSAEGEKWLAELHVGFSSAAERKYSHGTFFTVIAVLRGLGPFLAESHIIKNLFRQLANEIADYSIEENPPKETQLLLVTLDACFPVYDGQALPFTSSRQIIFAVKRILSWTETPLIRSHSLATESCRILRKMMPSMSEVYGSYWETALSFCLSVWLSHIMFSDNGKSETQVSSPRQKGVTAENVSELYASLDLVSTLLTFSRGDNEDLRDVFTEHSEEISKSLIALLQLPRDKGLFIQYGPTQILSQAPQLSRWSLKKESEPLRIFDELLSKHTGWIPLEHIKDLEDIYPLVASDGWLVQSAAFDLLNRALPEKQQQISVDVLLNGNDARLPDELLSLLLDAPTTIEFLEEELAQYPMSVRGYLLSWQLVFASYHSASHKVRNDYSHMLKSEDCITALLYFISGALGHSAASPLDLVKEHIPTNLIRAYDWRVGDAMGPERDMRYLLVNLFYLALLYTPSLVREWFMNCSSKQTCIAIERWTERFFSPLIIEDSMKSVTAWADSQEETDDEKKLAVKVSTKSREIFASYEVDETAIQIVIRLRESYPLDGVKVEGVNRVAVSEKKFQSWLINIQGVITFSNGFIPDGLAAFRKNVSGTLKGTEECSICYSIISADSKIPDKRCTTCNKLFHASCLYKWFKSSNQSTCPLCRNPFNYGTRLPLR